MITTLDPDGQQAALQALGGRKGSIVAMEPQTGRVRVMVSVPEYDPNQVPGRVLPSSTATPTRRCSTAPPSRSYPPGSTFKVVTAAAALDTGKYTPQSIVDGLLAARRSAACRWPTPAARTSARSRSPTR